MQDRAGDKVLWPSYDLAWPSAFPSEPLEVVGLG